MARARTEPAAESDALDEPESGEESEHASNEVEKQEDLTVTQALNRVMGDVQSVGKGQRNEAQSYNFRGIDAVVNAVGPALREHGVVVVPIKTKYESEHYQTSNNKHMKGVTLTVTFRFYGPAGDYIDATATGEASDAGDKAMPKAHSVAFRTMLLQALCIPTDEPDPDLESHDRAAQPFRGSSGSEPQARPPRAATQPSYNWPKDWKELGDRMARLLGEEEAPVWIAQAVEVYTGEAVTVKDLAEEAKRQVWTMLAEVLRSLDEELKIDPAAFPPPTREEIAGMFAKHLDGMILAGPKWALSGTEAENGYPSKESVLGEASHDDQRQVNADGEPEESDAEVVAAEGREPTDEEIAEAQATLDEEAAEQDREQASDASGK